LTSGKINLSCVPELGLAWFTRTEMWYITAACMAWQIRLQVDRLWICERIWWWWTIDVSVWNGRISCE